MAPRELVFYNYNARFLNGAVRVKKEEIEVGDVLIFDDRRRPGCYPTVVEVCVMAVNADETVMVILRFGSVENVKLSNLWRPDWFTKPYRWLSGGPRINRRFRRPLFKDNMLKHGVEVARVVNYDSDESKSNESKSDDE